TVTATALDLNNNPTGIRTTFSLTNCTVTFAISDPLPFSEGDSGSSSLLFVVTRSGDTGPAALVDFGTQDGSGPNGAHAGTDYTATSGTLFFAAGQTTASIAVPVLGNTLVQNSSTVSVTLSNPPLAPPFPRHHTF